MLWVGAGGFFGANLRYLFSMLIPRVVPADYAQSGTLFVNAAGSLLLGVFLAWAGQQVSVPPQVRWFVATGFLGSYTTFSTFANEALSMGQAGGWRGAVWYVLVTNILCVLGALFGIWIGSRL